MKRPTLIAVRVSTLADRVVAERRKEAGILVAAVMKVVRYWNWVFTSHCVLLYMHVYSRYVQGHVLESNESFIADTCKGMCWKAMNRL